ncbi:DUF1569 domain-containing protein [uncultured Algibacter sp.]|uniref:DUF1569 domain-containing protein n=1 Tax=uncultured Algibacter sp. TaxID=298659 RepID=UPI00260AA677|nr:DUF1569 domain-containing protein [uncultured Algibacter sp.]
MSHQRINTIKKLLTEIEKNIPLKDKRNPSITKTDIGWQLDHSLKAINGISTILAKTDPKEYKKDFNFKRMVLFTLSFIPRGLGKAPKTVIPPDNITTEDLQAQLHSAKNHIDSLNQVHEKAYFNHHIFGTLNKAKTLRFLEVHTKHHLKIVNDILKQ